jgi:hypothetical protein
MRQLREAGSSELSSLHRPIAFLRQPIAPFSACIVLGVEPATLNAFLHCLTEFGGNHGHFASAAWVGLHQDDVALEDPAQEEAIQAVDARLDQIAFRHDALPSSPGGIFSTKIGDASSQRTWVRPSNVIGTLDRHLRPPSAANRQIDVMHPATEGERASSSGVLEKADDSAP